MAEANEKLRQHMQDAPDGHFDIERVEDAQKIIEMVGLFLDWANVEVHTCFVLTEWFYIISVRLLRCFFSVTDTQVLRMFFFFNK